MRIEFDKESGAFYVYLRGEIGPGEVEQTVELVPEDPTFGAYLDLDDEGRPLGLEFLSVREFGELLERVGTLEIPERIEDPERWSARRAAREPRRAS